MVPLTVRIVYGENTTAKRHPAVPASMSVTRAACFAALRWAQDVVLVLNNIRTPWIKDYMAGLKEELSGHANFSVLDATDWLETLPGHLHDGSEHMRSAWRKFVPPRLNPDGHEIFVDNDLVLWTPPPMLEEWVRDTKPGTYITLGSWDNLDPAQNLTYRAQYGLYTRHLLEREPQINICCGIIGIGPSGFPCPLEDSRRGSPMFTSEQGWAAENYLEAPRGYMIPFSQVPIVCQRPRFASLPDDWRETRLGLHFTETNVGRSDMWEKRYQQPVEEFLGMR